MSSINIEDYRTEINILKQLVLETNLALCTHNLIKFTWGNVSQIHRESGIVAIKPSGVSYDDLKIDDIVLLDLQCNILEGTMRPSSDTPTHLELYREFSDMGGIVHTHSPWATSWAQAGREIEPYGTTHGDYFYGSVLCTRQLRSEEVETDYELNTGRVIVETIRQSNRKSKEMPGILVKNHGPFTWGKDSHDAVHNAVVLEELSKMAYRTLQLSPNAERTPQYILDKHYQRKHGKDAYYGQK